MLMISYAALGLLPNIPLPTRASAKSYKASLPFLPPHLRAMYAPGSSEADKTAEVEAATKSRAGYGRIVRDAEGNVVDIIIDQEPEHEAQGGMDVDMEEKEDGRKRVVEGKTDVVRCEWASGAEILLH
jgi:nucleolar protein 16